MKITDIVKHLPEVGDPVLAEVRAIEQMEKERDEMQERINAASSALRENVKKLWTAKEIETARAILKEEQRQAFLAEQRRVEAHWKRFDMRNNQK